MSSINTPERGAWSSKLGFILAAAGSAIGLGNIWRFPVETAQNGGAAFVFVYLICVFAIGIPVMIAELSVGRRTRSNPVGAFKKLAPGSLWKAVGGLGVLTGLMILSAYAVVSGWILKYLWYAVAGTFRGMPADQIGQTFSDHIQSGPEVLIFHLVFLGLTMLIVQGGVQGGIEKASKTLMPFLLLLLVLLCFRSVTLAGAGEGLSFYLNPDFSKINFSVIMSALGQAFFSLSLGMGAMITYGSYLAKKDNLASAAAYVSTMDAGIAILAGFVIFPALFSFPELIADGVPAGPGLIFVVLPNIFNSIPLGYVVGIGFFFLVAIAALTSTISLLEVVVAFFIDELGWTRRKAVYVLGSAAFVIGIPSALSNGASGFLSDFAGAIGLSGLSAGGSPDFMSLIFTWFGEISLVVGALLLCIFLAWKWGLGEAVAEVRAENAEFPMAGLWKILVAALCPLAIIAILVSRYVAPLFSG